MKDDPPNRAGSRYPFLLDSGGVITHRGTVLGIDCCDVGNISRQERRCYNTCVLHKHAKW